MCLYTHVVILISTSIRLLQPSCSSSSWSSKGSYKTRVAVPTRLLSIGFQRMIQGFDALLSNINWVVHL